MSIICKDLHFSYNNLVICSEFNLEIERNKTTVLLGPSGCGKTTLLNLIADIISPHNGNILLPEESRVSYLFQEPRLLNWKTVYNNIKFVLDDIKKEDQQKLIEHFLTIMDLSNFSHYYPTQLSGGMKQRVAIARAFAFPSNILLMDEPFKGLDAGMKHSLYDKYNTIWKEHKKTSLLVTHDIKEALIMGDKILILSKSPISILKSFTNPLLYRDRTPGNENFIHLEAELFKFLM